MTSSRPQKITNRRRCRSSSCVWRPERSERRQTPYAQHAPSKAADAITRLRGQFALLAEGPESFERWFALVEGAEVRGKRAHDARLAALLLSNGLTQILTLNTPDFHGLPGITAVHPSTL